MPPSPGKTGTVRRREQRAAANPAAAIEEDQDDDKEDDEEPDTGAVDVVEFEEWYEP
ncbi:hypothetical protein [Streptosporangium sp. NPDC002524]|uniref:hypothetical protein n=1 Tax=Streptosporangium sp. NPDC002524 TaxID=3154537 RepID=UPI003318665F